LIVPLILWNGGVNMPSKDEIARILAESHYRIEPEITKIFRITGNGAVEAQPVEPIKLLEVNRSTIPSGIMPLQFDASPAHGIPFPSVIVEVTPGEFQDIQAQALPLPNGWTLGSLIPPPLDV
jgi:hypothetical protein